MPVLRPTRLERVARKLAVGWLLACLATPIAAAPSVTPLAPDALRQALQSAWQSHPTARATEATLSAARARAEAGSRPLYNPELEFASDREGTDRTTSAGLSLTLDMSGKRRARTEVASARLQVEEAEARLRRRDFAAAWLAGWAERQMAQQRVRQGEQRLALIARFSDLADKQFTVGDISSLERDLAHLARDEAEAEQATLLAEQAEAEEAFRNVGGPPDALGARADWSKALPAPAMPASTAWEDLPEAQIARASATAAERAVTVARRDRIPDPTLAVSGGRIDYGPVTDNVVGVSISLPLLVRNAYRAEVVAAQGDADAAVAEAERVRLELQSRAARATASYAAVRTAWSRWQQSRGTDVDRRAALLERLWRAGELSTADYLLQLKQTLDTALAGAALEGQLWRRSTDYLAATGQLERWLSWDGATGDLSR